VSPSVARGVLELFGCCGHSDGHHDKTAAAELRVSVHTLNLHLKAIYEKPQVHSKSEAVAKALREGLIR
jgi:DNA-binding CsgD family transcriptional regulator